MKDGNAGILRWRRFIVDVLIGSATLTVGLAAIGTTAGILYIVLIAGALVGIGLMLEPSVMAQPAGDTSAVTVRPLAESKPVRPGSQATGWLDARFVDAASVL